MALGKNTATTLVHMGYKPLIDFDAYFDGATITIDWYHAGIQPTEADIAAAELPSAKSIALQIIRAQAQDVIVAKWPIWKQINAQSGVYGPDVLQQCTTDIAAVIEASNTAEDAIDAATTPEQAEAVTATWPVI